MLRLKPHLILQALIVFANTYQLYAQTPNYAEALQKVVWFLETQRDGRVSEGVKLPDGTVIPNRVNWRSDSYLSDGKAIKNDPYAPNGTPDLTGGLFDAGDPPKWSPGLAMAATMLSWGIVEYPAGYKSTGQLKYSKGNIKWLADYFLKCFSFDPNNPNDVSKYRIYIVVGGSSGGGSGVEKYQGKDLVPQIVTFNEQNYLSCQHETIENTIFNMSDFPNYQRPVYYADKDAPATSTVSKFSAALASASIVFRGDGSNAKDVEYANLLLERAKMLLNFSKTYLIKEAVGTAGVPAPATLKNKDGKIVDNGFAGGRWDSSINKHRPGTDFAANLCWSSLWIHQAELG
ncbi:MAG TPA: glycoside hydrolase family 9 protein, partial [Cytophagaceae bacterium]